VGKRGLPEVVQVSFLSHALETGVNSMKRNMIKTFAAAAVIAMAGGAAQAQVLGTTDFEVKVKIVDGCSVTLNGGNIVFSDRTQIVNDHRDGQVTVACTAGNADVGKDYGLTLSPGLNGDQLNRRMNHLINGAANQIVYQVHTLANCAAPVWGDGTNGTEELKGVLADPTGTPVNTTHTFRVCMLSGNQIQPATAPAVGDYADFLQITLHL